MKTPVTINDILEASEKVKAIPKSSLVRIKDEMNHWNWPEELGEAPAGWEAMTMDEKFKHPKFRAICSELDSHVFEKASLRYHHIHNLGRTEEEFEDWWQSRMWETLEMLRDELDNKRNQSIKIAEYCAKNSTKGSTSKRKLCLKAVLGFLLGMACRFVSGNLFEAFLLLGFFAAYLILPDLLFLE